MTKPGLLVVLSGPSGVGKDTVLRHFMRRHGGCALSVSATTRGPRPGETDGLDYHFLSMERFSELVARGEMLEYAQFDGNLYGTPKEEVDRLLAEGKNVILEIEVQGAMQVKKLRPDAVFVFVAPPSWECLRRRLQKRGTETEPSLRKRLDHAAEEMRRASEYDYILVNDDIDRCAESLAAVIQAAGCSVRHMKDFIEEVQSHA